MGKIALAAIMSLCVIPASIMVNRIVPEPYMVRKSLLNWRTDSCWYLDWYQRNLPSFNMIEIHDLQDEIFHVPQAKHYCKGNFGSWDPMITTPPGLYVLYYLWCLCLWPHLQEKIDPSSLYQLLMCYAKGSYFSLKSTIGWSTLPDRLRLTSHC